MNEFIVWDELSRKFVTQKELIKNWIYNDRASKQIGW